jgi:anaerobic ribonucleoside-triphosphate reductase activating protein
MSVDELLDVIEADPFANVTFSGGDPMQQAEGFTELATAIKARTHKTIWCYTGYTYEALLHMPSQRRLLDKLDVLVDGPYVAAQHNSDLVFRGSANQRIIDVPRSLRSGRVELWERR